VVGPWGGEPVDIDDDIVNLAWFWFNDLMPVFHLKYRPAILSELDLLDVSDKLKSLIKAKEMPQSFLFSGPKGAGKTSAARIFARTINCLEIGENKEACGKCENCKEIAENRSMDIIEMDAASNRGIEDVRNLKEKAYLLPTKLKYKVFIVDEVHMLTKDAFNALLKLIEEPPKHTVFILCTTDADKIPETVLSRLVKVDFRKGNKIDLKRSLDKIIKGEGIKIDDQTEDFILSKSDGSFRNLQKNFNELFLSIGNDLNLDLVQNFYINKSGDYSIAEFEKDLSDNSLVKIIEKLEKMADVGVNLVDFRGDLMNYFQQKLLISVGAAKGEQSLLDLKNLETWINLLIRAAKQEKEVEIDQLPLELAVIDFLTETSNVSEKPVFIKATAAKEEKKIEEKEEIDKFEEVNGEEDVLTIDVSGVTLEKVKESWGNILLAVKPFNHSVEAFLRASRPIKLKERNLTLEVFYPFHKDRLEEPKNKGIVEKSLLKVLGVELVFNCILGKNKKEPLVIRNDTPMESVSEHLVEEDKDEKKDLYDVAKDIFG